MCVCVCVCVCVYVCAVGVLVGHIGIRGSIASGMNKTNAGHSEA